MAPATRLGDPHGFAMQVFSYLLQAHACLRMLMSVLKRMQQGLRERSSSSQGHGTRPKRSSPSCEPILDRNSLGLLFKISWESHG